MIERLSRDPQPIRVRPTRERLVVDGDAILEAESAEAQRSEH
jgi:hypothetical protein